MRRRLLIALLLTAMAASVAARQQAPEIDSIRKADMKADLFFLASDAMGGRLTDTTENRLAAEWVASRFQRLGLEPAGDNGSYFQAFTLVTAAPGAGNRMVAGGVPAKHGGDFTPARFSASATAKGEIAFVGFGITSPVRGYDDYDDSVRGKIVLAINHEPGESDPASPFDGIVTAQDAGQVQKTLAAQAKGAAGILFVADLHNHDAPGDFARTAAMTWPAQPPRIPRYMLGAWVERIRIPAALISPALADALLAKSGRTLADLSKASESATGTKPLAVPGSQVELTTSVTRSPIVDRNVVALLPGADPVLRDEVVIVCAHYDHDGTNGTNVLNGADDDGSGTVGLIEIAEAFARAAEKGLRPRRSILFAAWNSEERGLFGAWAYAEQPLRPLEKTAAVLNMDMIGRNEEVPEEGGGRFRGLDPQTAESNANAVNVIGTTRSASLRSAIERANAGIGLTLRLRYDNNASQLMRRSDHWPFLNRGVPGVWFHTGLHPDYHTPDDDPDRINYDKMEKVARLVYQAAWDLGTQATRPSLGTR